MTYRPLSVRESAGQSTYDGPHDGVPSWLKPTLWSWVCGHSVNFLPLGKSPKAGVLQSIERSARLELDWSKDQHGAFDSLAKLVLADDKLLLDVVDFLLSESIDADNSRHLEKSLVQAGSVFTVERNLGPPPVSWTPE